MSSGTDKSAVLGQSVSFRLQTILSVSSILVGGTGMKRDVERRPEAVYLVEYTW